MRRRTAILAAAGLAVPAVAGLTVWALLLRGNGEPVSVAEAVEGFRAEPPASGGAVSIEPGVYVYATEGFEEVDALFGSRHDYPSETAITVTAGGCGLMLAWEPLAERSTTWELCPGVDGWTIAGYRELHTFFGNETRTDYRCEPRSLWWPARAAGFAWSRTCSTDGTSETARGTVLGAETAAGLDEGAVHLSLATTLEGEARGTGALELWLLEPSGLPAAIELENDNVNDSAIGEVRYTERVRLTLTSRTPRR